MKKKLVSVLMCMAMGATLLAGCGSEEAADSSNTTAADAADAVRSAPGRPTAVRRHLDLYLRSSQYRKILSGVWSAAPGGTVDLQLWSC